MKKLLFSRSQKKHFSDTVVRIGKNNLGFSLVELIVIIAIMAVLVAIAIPVLGMFIEKARIANDKQAVNDVMYAINVGGQSMQYEIEQEQIGAALKVPVGIIILGSNGVSVIGSNAANQAALNEMLTDALGEGFEDSLKLKYESWANAAYASFYSSADEMMDKVANIGDSTLSFLEKFDSSTANKLGISYDEGTIKINALFGLVKKDISIISMGYENADDLTYSLSIAVSNVDRETFIEKWQNLTSESSEGFGLQALPEASSTQPREYYSAVRAAYNQCFANYIRKNSTDKHSNCDDHANDILGWGESGTQMLKDKIGNDTVGGLIGSVTGAEDMTFPWAVCGETFSKHEDSSAANDDFVDCQYCADLWAEYSGSAQARADAAAFYDTMTAGASYDSGNADAPYEGMISWAQSETDTFTALYDSVNDTIAANEFSIMISVYQDADGLLYCECNTPGVLDE